MQNGKSIFRKIGNPSVIEIEYIKTNLASNISGETGLFNVPKILYYNKKDGVIDFEYLTHLKSLQNLISNKDNRLFKIFENLGTVLAIIHKNMELPYKYKKELPTEWSDSDTNKVFLHGDFTINNVCYHEPSEKLVILDWSTAPALDTQITFGTKYFDIHWFICSMFTNILGFTFSIRTLKIYANAFINSYFEQQVCKKGMLIQHQVPMYNLSHQMMWKRSKKRPLYKRIPFIGRYIISYLIWRSYIYSMVYFTKMNGK